MKHLFLISVILISCSSGNEASIDKHSELPKLTSWEREFVMNRDQNDRAYFNDHENFISEYFSVAYLENEIVATTLMEMDCVDSVIGKINVSRDTIFLKKELVMTDDRLCGGFHKFTFHISNPENKRYTVVSTK